MAKSHCDTLIKTSRKTYGADFALGRRGPAQLDTSREHFSGQSLSRLVKDSQHDGSVQ